MDSKVSPEASNFQMPYNDEYGIPILDLSSDTDDVSLFFIFIYTRRECDIFNE